MRQLASWIGAGILLCEVRAFPDVLFVTIHSLFAITQHSKITTNSNALFNMDMREEAAFAVLAKAVLCEVQAERCALRRRVVR